MENLKKLTILLVIISLIEFCCSINNGAGLTPPMGWIADKALGCNINESYFQLQASKLVQTSLTIKGYKFAILDGCWQTESRNENSDEIVEDFSRFTSGIQNLSKSIHNKGLKFGLSSDVGIKTCENRPGSYGYEKIDALKFSEWEVDYLKYNNCNHTINETKFRFYLMEKSLNETKRSIFFSLDDNGNDRVWEWGQSVANSWRTIDNYENDWNSFLYVLEKQIGLEKYASIGGWNDPGPISIENNLTFQEKYSQFVFWCIWKAPLILKGDLSLLSQEYLDILENEEIIAINQDSLGSQAKRIKLEIGSQFKREVWGGALSGNNYFVVFFNRGESQTTVSVSLKKEIGLEFSSYTQRDPIRHSSVGISNQDIISVPVAPHSVEVRVLSIIK